MRLPTKWEATGVIILTTWISVAFYPHDDLVGMIYGASLCVACLLLLFMYKNRNLF